MKTTKRIVLCESPTVIITFNSHEHLCSDIPIFLLSYPIYTTRRILKRYLHCERQNQSTCCG